MLQGVARKEDRESSWEYSGGSNVITWGFPGGSETKDSACNVGDLGSIPGLGRSPGEGSGNPLHYSCWRIPWTEEPGGLQSVGSQRVGHDWVTFTFNVITRSLPPGRESLCEEEVRAHQRHPDNIMWVSEPVLEVLGVAMTFHLYEAITIHLFFSIFFPQPVWIGVLSFANEIILWESDELATLSLETNTCGQNFVYNFRGTFDPLKSGPRL